MVIFARYLNQPVVFLLEPACSVLPKVRLAWYRYIYIIIGMFLVRGPVQYSCECFFLVPPALSCSVPSRPGSLAPLSAEPTPETQGGTPEGEGTGGAFRQLLGLKGE